MPRGAAAAAGLDDVSGPAGQVPQGLLEVAPVHRVEEKVEGEGGVVGQLGHLDRKVEGSLVPVIQINARVRART